jgi:hypothetical protein
MDPPSASPLPYIFLRGSFSVKLFIPYGVFQTWFLSFSGHFVLYPGNNLFGRS